MVTEALQTSEETVISEEKENVTTSYMSTAMKNHGYGTTVDVLQSELDKTVGAGKTEVTEKDGELIVKFVETGRSYIAGDVYVKEDVVEKIYLNPEEWGYTRDETTNTVTITGYKIVGATEVTIPNYIKIDNNDVPVKRIAGALGDGEYFGINSASIWSDEEKVDTQYYKAQTTIEKIVVSEGIEEISDRAFLRYNKFKRGRITKYINKNR